MSVAVISILDVSPQDAERAIHASVPGVEVSHPALGVRAAPGADAIVVQGDDDSIAQAQSVMCMLEAKARQQKVR
jgi:hypothetical protein